MIFRDFQWFSLVRDPYHLVSVQISRKSSIIKDFIEIHGFHEICWSDHHDQASPDRRIAHSTSGNCFSEVFRKVYQKISRDLMIQYVDPCRRDRQISLGSSKSLIFKYFCDFHEILGFPLNFVERSSRSGWPRPSGISFRLGKLLFRSVSKG